MPQNIIRRSGHPLEYGRAAVHVGRSWADRAGVWLSSGDEGRGKDLNDPLRIAARAISGGFRMAGSAMQVVLKWGSVNASGLRRTIDAKFCSSSRCEAGFAARPVLVARLPLPVDRYKTADQVTGFYRPLLPAIEALRVSWKQRNKHAAAIQEGFPATSKVRARPCRKMNAMFQLVSEGYFPVLKIQFIGGGVSRKRSEWSTQAGNREPDVREEIFDDENPIGRQVRIAQLAEFEDAVKEPTFGNYRLVADAKTGDCQDPPSRRFGYRTR